MHHKWALDGCIGCSWLDSRVHGLCSWFCTMASNLASSGYSWLCEEVQFESLVFLLSSCCSGCALMLGSNVKKGAWAHSSVLSVLFPFAYRLCHVPLQLFTLQFPHWWRLIQWEWVLPSFFNFVPNPFGELEVTVPHSNSPGLDHKSTREDVYPVRLICMVYDGILRKGAFDWLGRGLGGFLRGWEWWKLV